MLVAMETKFVVTNSSDNIETAKQKDRKIEVFAQSRHLRFSLTCG